MSGNWQRFHLSFSYINPERGWKNSGNQVVFAEDLKHAAGLLMFERKLASITIHKRFHANGRIDTIERTFTT